MEKLPDFLLNNMQDRKTENQVSSKILYLYMNIHQPETSRAAGVRRQQTFFSMINPD